MDAEKIAVITVDGPGGVGKGTVSKFLASKLGWHLLDSGAIYRVLALAAKRHQVALDNEEALVALAGHLDVQFVAEKDAELISVILESEVVDDDLRTEETGKSASLIAVLPRVREALLRRQRSFKEPPGLVADGRDMGTVVFPDAQLKIFLDASAEERAQRRLKQLKKKGIDARIRALLKDIHERDERDRNRLVAPLVPAEDAIVIDTTDLSVTQVIDCIVEKVNEIWPDAIKSTH